MDPILLIMIIAFAGPIVGSVIGVMRKPSFVYVCCMLCFAAGLMIYITVDELIPNSCAGENHQTIFSFMTGAVLVMLLQLV